MCPAPGHWALLALLLLRAAGELGNRVVYTVRRIHCIGQCVNPV